MKRNTAQQIKWLESLDVAALIKKCPEAILSLSRRKDAFRYAGENKECLEMMVRTGHAIAERHLIETKEKPLFLGSGGTFFDENTGELAQFDETKAKSISETLYIIDCGDGLRFDLNFVSADIAVRAVPGTRESFLSDRRTSASNDLAIAAQAYCVQLTSLRLSAYLNQLEVR